MRERSKSFYNAGISLLSQKCYDQSIVCFYYSVLQRMMYSLTVSRKRPVAYEKQNPLDEKLPFRMLEDIVLRMDSRYQRDIETVKEYFGKKLYSARKKADYSQELCSQDECVECRSMCEKVNSILDRFFNPDYSCAKQ